VVVNHDLVDPGSAASGASLVAWQSSALSNFTLSYAPPTIVSVSTSLSSNGSGSTGAAPAAGGFLLSIVGTNFGPPAGPLPLVLLGGLPCDPLPGSAMHTHTTLLCVAPPAQLDTHTAITVTVDGQSSSPWTAFVYDPPVLTAVLPEVVDAVVLGGQHRLLTLRGLNFGSVYRPGVAGDHAVHVDGAPCSDSVWRGDTEVSCVFGGELVVGVHNVTLSSRNHTTRAVPVVAACPRKTYGTTGERCLPCPPGAGCAGSGADPVALAGYYPVARARFVACAPSTACVGGADVSVLSAPGTLGCAKNYAGLRCADCRVGSYVSRCVLSHLPLGHTN
jgi:hypothetical protein